jgi:hypothetical protein
MYLRRTIEYSQRLDNYVRDASAQTPRTGAGKQLTLIVRHGTMASSWAADGQKSQQLVICSNWKIYVFHSHVRVLWRH